MLLLLLLLLVHVVVDLEHALLHLDMLPEVEELVNQGPQPHPKVLQIVDPRLGSPRQEVQEHGWEQLLGWGRREGRQRSWCVRGCGECQPRHLGKGAAPPPAAGVGSRDPPEHRLWAASGRVPDNGPGLCGSVQLGTSCSPGVVTSGSCPASSGTRARGHAWGCLWACPVEAKRS